MTFTQIAIFSAFITISVAWLEANNKSLPPQAYVGLLIAMLSDPAYVLALIVYAVIDFLCLVIPALKALAMRWLKRELKNDY